MEKEVIRRVLAKVVKKEFPNVNIEDVALTIELQSMMGGYIDEEKNLKYNVWIIFGDFDTLDYFHNNYNDWMKLTEFVKTTMKHIGIKNKINVYKETSEDY